MNTTQTTTIPSLLLEASAPKCPYTIAEILREASMPVAKAYSRLHRAGEQVVSRQIDLQYKVFHCGNDWAANNRVFYGNSLASTAADLERALTEWDVRMELFCDEFLAAFVGAEDENRNEASNVLTELVRIARGVK